MKSKKPTHVKPSLYAFFFEELKVIARTFGYNLVLHGSMNRDLDLIAIPWEEKLGDVDEMMEKFAEIVDGTVMIQTEAQKNCFPHGRTSCVINILRANKLKDYEDAEYYLDISVIPSNKK